MKIVVLSGGVGGAKLVLGLAQLPVELTVIVNTADDFRHFGLHVSPDIDTLLYTLSGQANAKQGWGREGESWNFMQVMKSLGGEDWFQLGDGDLALHVWRTMRLAAGESLSAVTADMARTWHIAARILPMSDMPARTMVDTDRGVLEFQHYFVKHQCGPAVRAIRFEGADAAVPAPGVLEAIAAADAVLLAPSNPYLSIDPILAVPGIASALATRPVVAVSPIVGGRAVKGPTAKLMAELGVAVDNAAIAAHYRGLVDGMLIHSGDSPPPPPMQVAHTDTMMVTLADRVRVAEAALALAGRISQG